ncbi:hypothetical protein LIA77_08135 [Sarocladium implicatum]|nr:hypothetical protein LIA77_08135 [Sarocladium implicatum]
MAGLEIVGAIASIGAILGGTRKTFSFIRSIEGIKNDWDRLNEEVESVELLFKGVQGRYAKQGPNDAYTAPICRALKQLEQILSDLKVMSERVSSERRASKSGAKEYKPNKRKWVWLKSDIAKTHDRLRDAKIDLNIAMRLADQGNSIAMMEVFQAMMAEFGTMTVQFNTQAGVMEQVQKFLTSSQRIRETSLEAPADAREGSAGDFDGSSLDTSVDQDEVLWTHLRIPVQAVSNIPYTDEARSRAFEALFTRVRKYYIRQYQGTLRQVANLIREDNTSAASSSLLALAEEKEPTSPWSTDLTGQPLRSIRLQIRQGNLQDALDAIQEQIEVEEEKLSRSPWELSSRWWHQRPKFEGASEEDWRRQSEFAVQMREEGLQRWRDRLEREGQLVTNSTDAEGEDGTLTETGNAEDQTRDDSPAA